MSIQYSSIKYNQYGGKLQTARATPYLVAHTHIYTKNKDRYLY